MAEVNLIITIDAPDIFWGMYKARVEAVVNTDTEWDPKELAEQTAIDLKAFLKEGKGKPMGMEGLRDFVKGDFDECFNKEVRRRDAINELTCPNCGEYPVVGFCKRCGL